MASTKPDDIKDLLHLAEFGDDSLDDQVDVDVDHFILDNSITTGTNKLRPIDIWWLYKAWKGKDALHLNVFISSFNKRFKQRRSSWRRYYLLSDNVILSQEQQLEIRDFLFKRRANVQKNKKEKEQKK